MRRQIPALLIMCGVAAACGPAEVPPAEAAVEEAALADVALDAEFAAIRDATVRFRDPEAALAAGYIKDPADMCVTAEMEGYPAEDGGMGVHFFRPDLLAITETEPRVAGMGTHTDFAEPGVLVYAPGADGRLELVAVENLVFRAGWEAAGNTAPPTFNGIEYTYLENDPNTEIDEAHGFEPHYEMHLWLHRDNPLGVTKPFNPLVSCEHYGHQM